MILLAIVWSATLTQALHIVLMLVAAPLLTGVVRRVRARLVGRAGPPVMQGMRDLARALRRQAVVAENASFVFRAAPLACLAALASAAFLVPSFALGMAFSHLSDLLVIAGLIGLARAALALAAMDVGTGFGGIGASREMQVAVFAEPAFLLVVLTLTLLTGTTNLDAIATLLREGGSGLRVSLGLALLATCAVALVEAGRIPAGDPAAHQEPAMVRGAMVLEYSGSLLAVVEYAAALKLLLWLSLIVAIFMPFGVAPAGSGLVDWGLGLAAWGGKILLLAVVLAVFETFFARAGVFGVPRFAGIAVLLAFLAVVFLFLGQGFA